MKIEQSVIGTTRKLSIVFINIKNSQYQTTHRLTVHLPMMMADTHLIQSPKIRGVSHTTRKICVRIRRSHEHPNAHETEDHTITEMRTRPKTTRAPKCARDRRPHEHRNAHETEYHTSTECNDFRFYNNVIQVNNLNKIEITFQIRT